MRLLLAALLLALAILALLWRRSWHRYIPLEERLLDERAALVRRRQELATERHALLPVDPRMDSIWAEWGYDRASWSRS